MMSNTCVHYVLIKGAILLFLQMYMRLRSFSKVLENDSDDVMDQEVVKQSI